MQVQPNKWSEAEFDSFVNGSLSLWREERISEPLEIYEAFLSNTEMLSKLFWRTALT